MAAAAGDPNSPVNWLIGHQRDVVWLIALALGSAGWLLKRFRTRPLGGPAPPSRASDVLAGLRVALVAAQNSKAQRTPGNAPGSVRRPAPAPPRGRATAPAAGGAAPPRPSPIEPPSLAARPPLLDAFRNPAGARTAVILAEILAPPVGLR